MTWSAKRDAPNESESLDLINACKDTLDRLVVLLPLKCGMRISECSHLNRHWCDFEKKLITLPPSQRCGCWECRTLRRSIWAPKSEAGERSLIMTPDVERALMELFAAADGINRSRRALECRFSKILERSGGQRRVYPHALRAAHATRLAENNLSAPSLAYVMGWASIEPSEAYIQSSMKRAHQELRQVYARAAV